MKTMLNLILEITYCEFYNNSDRRCYRIKANAYFVISTINKMYLKDFNLNAKKIIISLIIICAISLGLYLVALDNFCDQGEDFQQGICRFTILFPSKQP
ncbi:PhoP/PhoQ regulator MgrB [Proteus mirabilis]|nr:PhoP/PhoQ regulator MgrB [Proteus mirabilis]